MFKCEHMFTNVDCEEAPMSECMLLLLFNYSVVSDSLWPHGLQHTRLPYP